MSPTRGAYSLSELSDNFSEIHRAEAAKYVAHLASLRYPSRGSTAIPLSSRGSTAIPRSGVAGVSRAANAANTVSRAFAAFKKKKTSVATSPAV
jgi:hypothetical protein